MRRQEGGVIVGGKHGDGVVHVGHHRHVGESDARQCIKSRECVFACNYACLLQQFYCALPIAAEIDESCRSAKGQECQIDHPVVTYEFQNVPDAGA